MRPALAPFVSSIGYLEGRFPHGRERFARVRRFQRLLSAASTRLAGTGGDWARLAAERNHVPLWNWSPFLQGGDSAAAA